MAKTTNLSGIVAKMADMGDDLTDTYNKTKDLKVAQTSINAYKTAISASKAQLIYKKLTGKPKNIDFME